MRSLREVLFGPKSCYDCERKSRVMFNASRAIDDVLVGKTLGELTPSDEMGLHSIARALRLEEPLIALKRKGSPYTDRFGNKVNSMYEVMRNNFVAEMKILAQQCKMLVKNDDVSDAIDNLYDRRAKEFIDETNATLTEMGHQDLIDKK